MSEELAEADANLAEIARLRRQLALAEAEIATLRAAHAAVLAWLAAAAGDAAGITGGAQTVTRLCTSCGRSISRGNMSHTPTSGRCLVCRVDADLAGWRYVAPNAEQRRANCRATYARRKARLWRAMRGN